MPKLNVQQNNQNVIQAFRNALAIGNLKGIIASDGSHNFSTAGSNRNLLDNPWFTVNQRGVNGTITNGQYGLDRWMAGGGTVAMATGGITLGAGNSYAMQRPADPSIFNGKTVTLSVMTSDGVVESGTVVAQTGSAKTVRTAHFELCIGYTAYNSFYFYNISSSDKTVIATKLELGSVSTLANDVPPEYGTELLKCMQYFIRIKGDPIGSGYVTAGLNQAYINIPTPVPMRTAPTASINGSMYIRGTGATWNVSTVTVPSASSQPTNGVSVIAAVSATQVMAVGVYMSNANSYIDLSADL